LGKKLGGRGGVGQKEKGCYTMVGKEGSLAVVVGHGFRYSGGKKTMGGISGRHGLLKDSSHEGVIRRRSLNSKIKTDKGIEKRENSHPNNLGKREIGKTGKLLVSMHCGPKGTCVRLAAKREGEVGHDQSAVPTDAGVGREAKKEPIPQLQKQPKT